MADIRAKTVHTTDVLVIGGSCSGLTAAITAKETDNSVGVLVVDRACSSKGWAGKAARTAGLISFVNRESDPEEFVQYCLRDIGFYLNDQHILRDYAYNSRRLVEHLEVWGVSVTRDENGKIDGAQWPFPWLTAGIDPDMCRHMSKYAAKLGVEFSDYIVVSELLLDGGRIAGAAGFCIKDGGFHIFLANAVILACGSQNFDITPVWCSKGAAQAMAFRAGAEMRNAEFACMGDFARKDPRGWIYYGVHGGAHTGHDHLYANGVNISQKWRPGFHSSTDPMAARAWYKETVAGNGPVMMNIGEFNSGGGEFFKFHPEATRRLRRHQEISDYPFDSQIFEVVPGVISELSCVRVNSQMETSVPGLFAVGDACGGGSARGGAVSTPPAKIHGTGLLNAFYTGEKGGAACVTHARAIRGAGLKYAPGDAVLKKLEEKIFGCMSRSSGISPRRIIHRIQDAVAPCDYIFIKTAQRIHESLEILEQAKSMLPDMYAGDYHELAKCVDAHSMIIGAELVFRAALARTESRGFHLREDFPEQDDGNWLKWIVIKKDGDGMRLTFEDIPLDGYDYRPDGTKNTRVGK